MIASLEPGTALGQPWVLSKYLWKSKQVSWLSASPTLALLGGMLVLFGAIFLEIGLKCYFYHGLTPEKVGIVGLPLAQI